MPIDGSGSRSSEPVWRDASAAGSGAAAGSGGADPA
jgi:hypothetical protein